METRNISEKIVKPARIICMTPDGRCVMAMVGEAGVSKTKVRCAQVRLAAERFFTRLWQWALSLAKKAKWSQSERPIPHHPRDAG
jgi:hypothetical protein